MTLSIEQWIVAAAGALLVVALASGMLLTAAGITWRRSVTLLIAALVFAAACWMLGGATIAPGRSVVLVASCKTSGSNIVAAANRLLPAGDSLDVLLFRTAAGTPCSAAADVANGPGVRYHYVVEATDFDKLMAEVRRAGGTGLAGLWHNLMSVTATRTVVLLYDPTATAWDSSLAADLPAAREALSNFPGELFVSEADNATSAYALSAEVGPGLRPGLRLDLQYVFLDLSVHGGPPNATGPLTIDLCVSLDRTTSFTECQTSSSDRVLRNSLKLSRDSTIRPRWTWYPGGNSNDKRLLPLLFGAASSVPGASLAKTPMQPGWHFLEFRARIVSGDGNVELPPHVVYVNADSTGPSVIIGDEALTKQSWPKSLTAAKALFTETWGVGGARRLNSLAAVPVVPLAGGVTKRCLFFASEATPELLEACTNAGRSLILIEPDVDLLNRLTLANVPRKMAERGAAILIAGPPAIPSGDMATLKSWLPAWPKNAGGPRQMIHSTRDVVLLSDCSGLAHLPYDDSASKVNNVNADRPGDVQARIVKALRTELAAVPGITFAPLASSATDDLLVRGETVSVWAPAVQVQLSPGCLRSADPNMPTTESLVEFAGVTERIHAFLGTATHASVAPFAAFEAGHRHPGSVIVVFTTRAAQIPPGNQKARRNGGPAEVGLLSQAYTSIPVPVQLLKTLADAGIRVLLIELPTSKTFHDAADARALAVGGLPWNQALNAWKMDNLVEHLVVPTGELPADTAKNIMAKIGIAPSVTVSAGTERRLFGRALDPRFPTLVEAVPSVILDLNLSPETEILVAGASSAPFGALPLVVARHDLGAPVIALAYSPFDPVPWASDLMERSQVSDGFKSVCLAEPCPLAPWIAAFSGVSPGRMTGTNLSSALGVQRMIDAVEQASWVPQSEAALRLVSVAVAPRGDAADLHFALPTGLTAWSAPRIELPAAQKHCDARAISGTCPLRLIAVDPTSRQVVYRLSTTAPGGLADQVDRSQAVPFKIVVDGADSSVTLPLRLESRTELASTGTLTVNLLRSVGAVLLPNAIPKARRSAVTLVILLLFLATMLLFTPLVRPWHAFSRFRRRRRREIAAIGFDEEIVSERAGHLPAAYEASRRSGDPAWMRPFQSGDSMSRAIVADLVGLSTYGAQLGFPTRLPRVRLREIGESFDLIIGIDDAPAMCHPGDVLGFSRKRATVEALVAIVATAVTQKGGRWSIIGLRSEAGINKFSGKDPEAVTEILSVLFDTSRRDMVGRTPASLSGTAPRLLISDFLSQAPKAYVDWIGRNGGGAILIRDDAQAEELGLGYDSASGALYDRSVWEKRDAAEMLGRRRAEARFAVEQAGGAFAEIDVDATDAAVAEILTTSGVLNLARR